MNLGDLIKAKPGVNPVMAVLGVGLLRLWPCEGSGWSPFFDGERCFGCERCQQDDQAEVGSPVA